MKNCNCTAEEISGRAIQCCNICGLPIKDESLDFEQKIQNIKTEYEIKLAFIEVEILALKTTEERLVARGMKTMIKEFLTRLNENH